MQTRRNCALEELQKRKGVKTKKKRWFRAVASANEAKVAEMLIADPTLIDVVGGRLFAGFTALHVAASKGLDRVVSQLLAAKPTWVDSLTRDDLGLTALHVAAERGHDKVIELLLAAKCSVDATDFDGRTALHCATKATPETVGLLLALAPTLIDVCDEEGRTALIYAIKGNSEDMVNQLLAANPKNLDAADASGLTALHHAILQGKEALVWRLLEMKPDLIYTVSGPDGRTPLRMATGRRRHAPTKERTPDKMAFRLFQMYPQTATGVEKVRLLLNLSAYGGSDSDFELIFPISTFDQIVASFKAAVQEWGYEDRLRSFVDEQCGPLSTVLHQDVVGIVYEYLWGVREVAVSPEKGMKRWFEAVETANETLVAELLREKPSLIDAIDRDNRYTALHFASCGQNSASHDKIVAQLVAAKPSLVAQCDRNGDTPLHLAAFHGNESIVEILLAASPSVGLMGNLQGSTPLICACMSGDVGVAKLLLAACPAALNLVDRSQYTPLLHASFKRLCLVELLLSANPQNIETTDHWDRNVLHFMVCHGHGELVARILTMQPSLVRTRTDRLQTPLWLAVDKEYNVLIEELFVRFPQAVHMADEAGVTPYHRAVQLKNTFAIELFSPKLTVDEMIRGYRKHHDKNSLGNKVERCLRSVVVAQCAEALFAQLPSAMDIVCLYLGFGSPLCKLVVPNYTRSDMLAPIHSQHLDLRDFPITPAHHIVQSSPAR